METVRYKLNRFFDWLEEEATGWKVVKILLFAFAIKLAYACSIEYIMTALLQVDIPKHSISSIQLISDASIFFFSFDMVKLFIAGAVWEEAFFRFIPLFLVFFGAMLVTDSLDVGVKAAFVFAIPMSILFGYLHGGVENIFLQGVGGMIYSVIFLKLGAAQDKFFKGWFYSSTLHFSFNLSAMLINALFFGHRYFTGLP